MTVKAPEQVVLVMLALTWAGVVQGGEAVAVAPASVAETLPPDMAQLRELVTRLDDQMFDAYNAHDTDRLMAAFATDLEFYHDTGGLLGLAQVRSGFANVFAHYEDIRRDLVVGSLEVYPIKDYGAIEVGAHRFCHTENGAPDCGTFRFMQIWRLKDKVWQVTREVSYGH